MVNITSKMILAQIYREACQRVLMHCVKRSKELSHLTDNMGAWAELAYLIHFSSDTLFEDLLKDNVFGFNEYGFKVGTSNCNGTDIEQQLTEHIVLHLFYNNGTTVVDTDGSAMLTASMSRNGSPFFRHTFRLAKL